ncbi:MAG: family 10 glycosylhydrolase [Porphyromonadaceae bacterium]|nr:family 10 glycosylhydrolase [Porphyromonadaceae bacterium]
MNLLAISFLGSCKTKVSKVEEPKVIVSSKPIVSPPKGWMPPLGDSIRHEMRAVWLTIAYGLDWPSVKADTPNGIRKQKEELDRILDRLKYDGYNTIFYQARLSGSVTYQTSREPFARVFTSSGSAPGYDPLGYAVEACRKRGLAIHAWLVTYPLSSSKIRPHPLLKTNRHWLVAHKGGWHLDPGLPEVRSYIANIAKDIVERYEVDGIHFDYFRYPEEADKFNDAASHLRHGMGLERTQWRCKNLTDQLREVNRVLRSIRPDIQISVAPLGKLRKLPHLTRPHGWTALESVHQDVETWADEHLVDFVAPMMYYKDMLYEPFLIDWMERVGSKIPVVAGLAPYRIQEDAWSPNVIAQQIAIARQHGASGVSMFREKNIGPSVPVLRTLIQRAFVHTALPLELKPRVPHVPRPVSPHSLSIVRKGQLLKLSWAMAESSALNVSYRVWATVHHRDGSREGLLLVQGLKDTHCSLRLSDFPSEDCIELGVEAVDAWGRATPCFTSVEYNLANERYLE